MVEWGLEHYTSTWRGTFDRRGDLQNKGLRCSSKNMSEESKTSICLSKACISERERERERKRAQACCSCVMNHVEGFDGTYIYSSGA